MININFRGKKIVTFDIETTGLSPLESKFICASIYNGTQLINCTSLEELNNTIRKINKKENLLVGFNTGNFYNKGFDFHFLRYKYVQKDLDWNFSGFQHLDYYSLFDKHFKLFITEVSPYSVSSMNKPDLVKLAKANNIEYTTKDDTYERLNQLENTNWLDYTKEKEVSKMSEQDIYQSLFDPQLEEEYIDGADVPEMYKQGRLNEIITHCNRDVERLYRVIERTLYVLPDENVMKVIEYL